MASALRRMCAEGVNGDSDDFSANWQRLYGVGAGERDAAQLAVEIDPLGRSGPLGVTVPGRER